MTPKKRGAATPTAQIRTGMYQAAGGALVAGGLALAVYLFQQKPATTTPKAGCGCGCGGTAQSNAAKVYG